jgi:transcriptional regulator with XRE-family HTH domain
VIRAARRKTKLTQRQLAALIKTADGRGLLGPNLDDIERGLGHPPRGFLLQEFAKVLALDMDLLYCLARQVPFAIDFSRAGSGSLLDVPRDDDRHQR